ncbi:hypothetical protein [Georgenia subflava]|uniref:hypothetical protein n=1 Tax=Georgenia subflava TaxID=1622177 RepID=UPI00186B42B1|nr:hypothetical protein [Georgenia subflava]
MSENDDQPGQSDWVRPGASPPGATSEESERPVSPSTDVHGEEGGGDPAAGAEEDSVGGGKAVPSGPDGGHRSGREGG